MHRRRFLTFAAGVQFAGIGSASRLFAQEFPDPAGDELYKPIVGQAGKDVVWVPTPDSLVRRMLEQAKVTADDVVYDLGCGDGKIPIAAARLFGATAKGIEYDADMADLARRNVDRARVADKVEIITGDIFDPALQERYMQATVVTMYLLPNLNLRLRPTILKMHPGTRVVSHAWHMGEWEPDDAFSVEGREGFYWVVPATAAGRWTLRTEQGWQGVVELTQQFQRIGGRIRIKGKTQQLLGPYVRGQSLGFTFVDGDNNVKTVRANVWGDELEGALRHARFATPLKGRRQPGAR